METRQLGHTGIEVSAIGLGMEHVECTPENMREVLETAVAGGVSYIDTLYGDPEGWGASFWPLFAPAVKPYRERLAISAHWSDWRFDLDACERRFERVLGLLGGHAEVGIIPMVDSEEVLRGPVAETATRLHRFKQRGLIRAVGMSGHAPAIALKAVEDGMVDVLMFGVNLLGEEQPPYGELLRACASRGVGVVAMKPFAGGTLLVASGKPTGISPLQCLSYSLAQPEVATTVPGARNSRQLGEILHYTEATPEKLDYRPALANIHGYLAGTCVYCNHCLPCPWGIDIGNALMMADWARAAMTDDLRQWYAGLSAKPSDCNECGQCEERCPFHVEVMAKLREAVATFEPQ